MSRIVEVKEWLAKTFEAAGKPVPEFECTPRSVAHLHNLLTLSKAKDEAAGLVASDVRQKAAEYRSQVGHISLKKTGVEEKRAKVQKESKILLDYTRKAIARLTCLN